MKTFADWLTTEEGILALEGRNLIINRLERAFDAGVRSLSERFKVVQLQRDRAENGIMQILDIAEQFVSNPGSELDAVDLVKKMAEILKDRQ